MGQPKLMGVIIQTLLIVLLPSCSLIQGDDEVSTMNEAIDQVVQEILPDTVPDGATYLCVRMERSIPAGSIIKENSLEENPATLVIDEESFFFLLDLAPRSYYAHPVKYIVVGTSGSTQVMEADWWPDINGSTPDQFLVSLPDMVYVIAGNADLTPAQGSLMEFNFDEVKSQFSEGFIVVKGLMPHEALYVESTTTYSNGIAFFNRYKNSYSVVDGLVDSQAITLFDVIDRMVREGRNPITIYIIAHGYEEWMRLSNRKAEAVDFQSRMAAHPHTEFNILLGCCHSGSFVDDLQILPNVRVIGTVCAWDEQGKPDIDTWGSKDDFNSDDTGSEWTSSVLDAASMILETPSRWEVIQSRALHYGIPLTCVMLYEALRGAVGLNPGLDLSMNLDLSNRAGLTTPQIYKSW